MDLGHDRHRRGSRGARRRAVCHSPLWREGAGKAAGVPRAARDHRDGVAIVGGLATVAAQFIPGIGVDEEPPPEASMEVRQVHTRITRGEFANRTGSTVRLSKDDQREVGNVVWLEIGLRGYSGKRPALQYGLYDRDRGADGALLPGTAKEVNLQVEANDAQTSLVPIWVGYPRSARFEVQFRLVEGKRVRQMAARKRCAGRAIDMRARRRPRRRHRVRLGSPQ